MSLANCCRLCLKDLSNFRPVEHAYVEITKSQKLQLMILNCFEILISDDEAVSKICTTCNGDVLYVNDIRKKVQAADSEIKKFYARLEIKQEMDVSYEAPEDSGDTQVEILELYDEQEIEPISNDLDQEKRESSEHEHEMEQKAQDSRNNSSLKNASSFDLEDANKSVPYTFVRGCKLPPRVKKPKEPSLKKLTKPKRAETHTNNLKCYICSTPTDFEDFEKFCHHFAVHRETLPEVCPICSEPVRTARNYNAHLKNVHNRLREGIPCEECAKSGTVRLLSSKFKLKMHIRSIHEGFVEVTEPKFVCSFCGKKYTRAASLKAHENVHTKAVMYQCNKCELSFTKRTALTRHEYVHLGEKPYKCDLCGATFRQSYNVQLHKANRHSDARPFGCEICGSRFKVRMALNAHIKNHGMNKG